MAITSKERVLLTFAYKKTDRIPCWCGASPEFLMKVQKNLGLDEEGFRLRIGDDFRRVFSKYKGPDLKISPGCTWISPFGIERKGIGYGQPVKHPLSKAKTIKEILDYQWPEPEWMDVSRIRQESLSWSGKYAILGGEWSPFWHDAIDLVGMENLYYMMYDSPELAKLVFDKITGFYYKVSENTFEAAGDVIDIFFIGNDFGSQNGPLIGLKQFERFILPSLLKLIQLGHRYGLKVMLHSCGGYRPLIPLMIKSGLDALHSLQPKAYGMEPSALKEDYGNQILLNGAIDSQLLIEGAPETVKKETLRILKIMSPGGGYISGASHDYILEETPLENVLIMFDTILDYKISTL